MKYFWLFLFLFNLGAGALTVHLHGAFWLILVNTAAAAMCFANLILAMGDK